MNPLGRSDAVRSAAFSCAVVGPLGEGDAGGVVGLVVVGGGPGWLGFDPPPPPDPDPDRDPPPDPESEPLPVPDPLLCDALGPGDLLDSGDAAADDDVPRDAFGDAEEAVGAAVPLAEALELGVRTVAVGLFSLIDGPCEVPQPLAPSAAASTATASTPRLPGRSVLIFRGVWRYM